MEALTPTRRPRQSTNEGGKDSSKHPKETLFQKSSAIMHFNHLPSHVHKKIKQRTNWQSYPCTRKINQISLVWIYTSANIAIISWMLVNLTLTKERKKKVIYRKEHFGQGHRISRWLDQKGTFNRSNIEIATA